MPPPESPPPRPGSASGHGLPPDSFAGSRRDLPSPQDFIPSIARDLLHALPTAKGPVPSEVEPEIASFLDDAFVPAEKAGARGGTSHSSLELPPLWDLFSPAESSDGIPAMGSDTALSLQQLTGALLSPPKFPASAAHTELSPTPAPETGKRSSQSKSGASDSGEAPGKFSLSDLAGQLSSRLIDQRSDAAGDLLAPSVFERGLTFESRENPEPDRGWGLFPDSPVLPPLPDALSATPSAAEFTETLPPAALDSGMENTELLENQPPPPWAGRIAPPPSRPGHRPPSAAILSAGSSTPLLPLVTPEIITVPGKSDGLSYSSEDILASDPHPLFTGLERQPPPLPPATKSGLEISGTGLGLALGGAVLVVLGLFVACTLPLDWLKLSQAGDWTRQTIKYGMLIRAACAGGFLILGSGSLFQKKWAPPLIHASAWLATLLSSGIMAAAAWHSMASSESGSGTDAFSFADAGLLLAALGLALTLILFYQRPEVQSFCASQDPSPCWTDRIPIPGLMVFVTGLLILVTSAGMLFYHPALPLAGRQLILGPPAAAAWVALGLTGLGSALAAFRRHSAAFWLLLAVSLLLAAGPAFSALAGPVPWSEFLTALGKPPAGGSPLSSFAGLLTGLSPLPLLLILAMARHAFSPPSPS